jgi:hypothetical protein
MHKRMMVTGFMGLLAVVGVGAGCSHDKPAEYGRQRPPVSELDSRDRGLQSKDVVQASDEMAMKLLADRDLNASKDQWTIVVGNVKNDTVNARHSLDIFLERLKVNLARHGKGRVQLIQNRADYRDRQAGELEIEPGSHAGQPGPKGIQPDYQLDAKVMELPNRGTSYYLMEFSLNNMGNRTIAWTDAYEVRVAR